MKLEIALAVAGELLLAAACHGCSAPWWGICPRCRLDVLSYGCFVARPDPCPVGFPFTVSAAPYDAILRQFVAAHKERGAFNLTPFLAGRLAAAFRCHLRVPSCGSEASTRPGLWRGEPLDCSDGRHRSGPAGCCIRRVRYAIRRDSAPLSEPPIFRAPSASPARHLVRP